MKTLLAVLFFLLVIPAFAGGPAVDKAHKATHEIGQFTINGAESVCTAVAIGPQALLTASHCELPTNSMDLAFAPASVLIVGRMRDGMDHTVLFVQGTTFTDYVDVDLTPVEISDDFFTFGYPGEWDDVYQRGYLAAVLQDPSHRKPDTLLFAFQAFPGESGAGVFNADGKLVAILSYDAPQTDGPSRIAMAGAYPFAFTRADIDKARAFSALAAPGPPNRK